MRIFAFLFAFYILAVSVMPCMDNEDCTFQQEQTASSPAHADHSDHDQDAEHCPPFCICACCGQTCSTDFFQYHISMNTAGILQDYPAYIPAFPPEVFFTIWQPPKVS